LAFSGGAFLCLAWQREALIAQTRTSSSVEAQSADKQLNESYQQLLHRLPAGAQAQVRKAQRAWLTFSELNNIAIRATAGRLGLPGAETERAEIEQMRTRTGELGSVSDRGDTPDLAERLQRADEQLNIVYKRCISTLPPPEVSKLREAQRAWVVFREASRPFGLDASLHITSHRTDQLHDFYIRSETSPAQAHPQQIVAPTVADKADPTTPDPFERAR
jgi:uncharacterized protein YecT (DUF1311 family)